VPDQDDHLRKLNAELDELRRALVKLRAQLALPSATASRADALEAMHRHVNAIRTWARLLQTNLAESRVRLEQTEREAWDQKVRRADTTAKLKGRERLLEQIQRSVAWKIVKPIWKLFNRSHKQVRGATPDADIAFALDLPKRWETNRDVLLIKGWCFSRSGRKIAGVRARIGRKTRIARYGLERPDVAGSFRDYPEAQQCGFTVEVKVPRGRSIVQLEAIEQGADWQLFLEQELQGDPTGDGRDGDDLAVAPERAPERILKLSSLSATKAFDLIQAGLRQHASRVGSQSPFISVLTPVHNTKPEWMAEAALSLLNQTFSDWEWCLVDDGSDNRETKKLLEILGSVGPRVRVSSSPAKGISAASNHALDLARGEYVCFLDHDDPSPPGRA